MKSSLGHYTGCELPKHTFYSRKMETVWIFFTLISLSSINTILGSQLRNQRSIRNNCPAKEEIPKCSCSISAKGLSVNCKRFNSNADVQSHLKNLNGYYLKKLTISNFDAPSIPTTIFKGLEIEELSLENIEVNDASFRRGQIHLQGLENSLELLDIRNSFKNGQRPLLNLKLDHLQNLQHVIMEENEIPEVGNDWFSNGPKKLSTLVFEKNGIEELGDRAFNSLSNLRLLAVSGNHLNSITREMLPQSSNLFSLDFSYNKIRNLPDNIFSKMPALTDVNLEYNLIHVIQKHTWEPISSQLNSLYLQGNVLQCDENMQWICDTRLKSATGKCSSPISKRGLSLQQFCK